MAYEYIESRQTNGVLVLTMDDPTTRNAIGEEMVGELNQELDRLESDPELRVLVLTGRDPSFCSGANVRRMSQNRERQAEEAPPLPEGAPWEALEDGWRRQEESGEGTISGGRAFPLRLHNLQKPSIAAVNGFAMGLGMGIALSCDVRIASEEARFSEAFIRNGLIPADGSCWQLPRLVGLSNTLLLQYTGDIVGAEEALRLGIASKVTPHDELMGATMDLAQRLAQGPTYAIALIKRLVQRSLETGFEQSLELATPAQVLANRTEDHREGVKAFVEKRKPVFKGR